MLQALEVPRSDLARMARSARERTLEEHTSERRAQELEALLGEAWAGMSGEASREPRVSAARRSAALDGEA